MTSEDVGERTESEDEEETGEVAAALPKALEVTPRRESNMMSSIAYTPTAEVENVYPFYCPLCMEHFADILFTPKCCRNHICVRCLKDYCATQGLEMVEGYSVNDVLFMLHQAGGKANQSMSCPQCMVSPYLPEKVAMSESRVPYSIKSYRDETMPVNVAPLPTPTPAKKVEDGDDPTTYTEGIALNQENNGQNVGSGEKKKKESTPERVSKQDEGNNLEIETEYSPVRVGDSFEDLKRKMKRFSQPGPSVVVNDMVTPAKSSPALQENENVPSSPESDGTVSPGYDIRGSSPVRSYVNSFIEQGLALGIAAQ